VIHSRSADDDTIAILREELTGYAVPVSCIVLAAAWEWRKRQSTWVSSFHSPAILRSEG